MSPATLVPVTIDTTAPTAPVADVAAESDNGASNTDNLTNDTTPTLRGTGSAGDTITVTLPTGEVLTTVVASDGSWYAVSAGWNNPAAAVDEARFNALIQRLVAQIPDSPPQ